MHLQKLNKNVNSKFYTIVTFPTLYLGKQTYHECCFTKNTIIFFFMKKRFIFDIPVSREILSVSPANNILIIHPWGKTSEYHQPSVKVEFSPSHCSCVVPFSLSLVEETDQVLSNGNQSVDPGSLVYKHLLLWLNTFLRIKKELKGTEQKNIARIAKSCPENIATVVEVSSCFY